MNKSSRYALGFASLIALSTLSGCIERQIRVTSTPPGARVWINDQQVGLTPVDTRFTFYGGYDVRLELDGYESVNELRQAKAPLHEYPGIDLVATALPTRFEHTTHWHFDLEEVAESKDPEQAHADLLARAAELRKQSLIESESGVVSD